MAGKTGTHEEEGREGSASGAATRTSRRMQGLLPEEQKSLDEINRESRQATAAKRRAAEEAKAASVQKERTDSGSAVQDAHQVSSDGRPDAVSTPTAEELLESSGSESSSGDEDESSSDESSGTSVEEDVKVEPPEEDRVSDSPQPDEEVGVEVIDESPTIKREDPLPPVQEEDVLEVSTPSPTSLPVPTAARRKMPSGTKCPVGLRRWDLGRRIMRILRKRKSRLTW